MLCTEKGKNGSVLKRKSQNNETLVKIKCFSVTRTNREAREIREMQFSGMTAKGKENFAHP